MDTMQVNGVRYAYQLWGDGAGVPLVLLHGFTGSVSEWANFGAWDGQRPVLAIDLLGHGQTDAPDNPMRYAMPQAAADVVTLAQTVLAKRPFVLLGYSMGGRLALYAALHYPQALAALILENSSPGLQTAEERAARIVNDTALADRIEREGITAFVDFWQSIPLFATQNRLPQSTQDAVRAQRLAQRPTGLANSLRGMGTGVQPSLWDDLSRLSLPTLLITGRHDAKFMAIGDAMSAQIPHAQRLTLDAGHNTHLEAADAFKMAVLQFVRAL